MASYSAIITSGEVIIVGGQILKMAVSRFVDVSLTTVITRIVFDKSTDYAKPHSIRFFATIPNRTKEIFVKIC